MEEVNTFWSQKASFLREYLMLKNNIMLKSLYVINSRGEKRLFSSHKVYRSAKRAGASSTLAKEIAGIIKKEVFPGINTSDIFKSVKQLLSKEDNRSAIKFSLKAGMRKLGPTGFPFEKYVGEIFKKLGFRVKINQYLPGRCLSNYEIDFVAQKDNLIYIGECKYRNLSGERVHSKDALANFARFIDILNGSYFKTKRYRTFKIRTLMATNTKFTNQARRYSQCMDVKLLGWRAPKNKGLEYLIEKHRLYPITILPSLSKRLIDIFIAERMMLAEDVLRISPQKFSKKFKIPLKFLNLLVGEAEILLKN